MTDVLLPRSTFGRGLSSVGVAVVAFEDTRRFVVHDLALWMFVVAAISVLAWAAVVILTRRPGPVLLTLLSIMVVAGGISGAATDGVEVVAAAVGLLSVMREPKVPIMVAVGYAVAAAVAVGVGAIIVPFAVLGIISMEFGLAVAFLGGLSRRQFARSERQALRLRDAELLAREEQARIDVLAARQGIAHDIHDLLAHSLGGLVIQLDAVDALLEAGDTGAAAGRVRDARRLAADGLSEARRAVAALRDGPADDPVPVSGADLVDGMNALVAANRSLGGSVELVEAGPRHEVNGRLAAALHRATQEALTNARKHAPGQPVTIRLDWGAGDVALRVENAVVTGSTDTTGGGHGLVGMRERFAALPGGVATAAVESGLFVVRVGGRTA